MSRETKFLTKSLNHFHSEIDRFRRTNSFEGRLEPFSRPEVGGDGVHTITTRFAGIPEKAVPPGKRASLITVLLVGKVWPQIHNKTLNTAAYTTEALYCDHKAALPNRLTAVHGFHFDYENSAPQAHPIFHAHYDLSASKTWYTEIDTRIEIQNVDYIGSRREHRAIRIPTAQMDIFSVILMIVAGHWIRSTDPNATKSFSRLLESTAKYVPIVDLARHANLYGNHLLRAGSLPSQAWYPVCA